jgi:hypothetical protein
MKRTVIILLFIALSFSSAYTDTSYFNFTRDVLNLEDFAQDVSKSDQLETHMSQFADKHLFTEIAETNGSINLDLR